MASLFGTSPPYVKAAARGVTGRADGPFGPFRSFPLRDVMRMRASVCVMTNALWNVARPMPGAILDAADRELREDLT